MPYTGEVQLFSDGAASLDDLLRKRNSMWDGEVKRSLDDELADPQFVDKMTEEWRLEPVKLDRSAATFAEPEERSGRIFVNVTIPFTGDLQLLRVFVSHAQRRSARVTDNRDRVGGWDLDPHAPQRLSLGRVGRHDSRVGFDVS